MKVSSRLSRRNTSGTGNKRDRGVVIDKASVLATMEKDKVLFLFFI